MVPLRFLSREVLVQGDHIHVRGAIGKVSGGLDLQTRDFNLPNPCVEMTRKSLGGLHCPVDGRGGVCGMKAVHVVKKMVNYYPPIAHRAQQVKSLTEIMPHILHFAVFASN